MLETLGHIIDEIKQGHDISAKELDSIVRRRNRQMHDGARTVAKKRLMSRYLKERSLDSDAYRSWDIDEDLHRKVVCTLRAKPRRTASGVATITVLTKPWPCTSDCIYCPNDIRMPKSYLSDEPACQRAERNFFDPYLQVVSRLSVLEDMGHITDKVELIVLGGTWSDYPDRYRLWFTKEMFRALNDLGATRDSDPSSEMCGDEGSQTADPIPTKNAPGSAAHDEASRIRDAYASCGYTCDPDLLKSMAQPIQDDVDAGDLSYNEAIGRMDEPPRKAELERIRGIDATTETLIGSLGSEQRTNESASHRVVGLVFETRPDRIDEDELIFMRTLGATKIQMGLQSLDDTILKANGRPIGTQTIARAFELIRLFGFKTHIHLMVNLVGATPQIDIEQYRILVGDDRFKPDEVKLYPCALVKSAALTELHDEGDWHPYTEDELLEVLVSDVLATPPYTRISRMIRDISATDILVGNKKTNLRQMVEARAADADAPIYEMRMREISTDLVDADDLSMETIRYSTTATEEHFIQWVAPDGRLAGFLRLSLPKEEAIASLEHKDHVSLNASSAMIREVHVYGKVSKLHEAKEGTQHLGLGRSMIDEACRIAREADYEDVNVISSIGTRRYYSSLGFIERGLYQNKEL